MYSIFMAKSSKTEKIDKRAAALRDNLKRRKVKAKAEKQQSKESKDGATKGRE